MLPYTQLEVLLSLCTHSFSFLLHEKQLNSGKEKCATKPVLVNTLGWPRSEVVTIPKELWERLSAKEQSSLKTQISQEGENLRKNIKTPCATKD